MNTAHKAFVLSTIATVAVAGFGPVLAQTAPASNQVAIPANVLSITEIETRVKSQGITIKEIELEGLLAEVEGFDAEGRKVEIVLDRRSGETLSHKVKVKRER